jgi:putative hydrolase
VKKIEWRFIDLAYIITADYHTHTRYSDGKGSIEDNVLAAISKGLKKIAISDHGFNHIRIGMKLKDIDKMRSEIDKLNERYPSIKVLLGVEANPISLNGQIDVPDHLINRFDLISVGYHRAVTPIAIKDAWQLFLRNRLNAIYRNEKYELSQMNTLALINSIERYPISIITHPGAKAQIDIRLLAKHAAKKNVALEINPHHDVYLTRKDKAIRKATSHQQISPKNVEYVKIALEEGASFVINSDAHTPLEVGDFDVALRIAELAGVPVNRIINAEYIG